MADDRRRILDDPLTNRGTAFTAEERRALGLDGLLPASVETLEQQTARAHAIFRSRASDLDRYVNLRVLQDTNEVLHFRLLCDHLEETLPVAYTPTVGLAVQRFSEIFRRPRGLSLPWPERDRLPELLRNRPHDDVDVIVVTDGERILGLGDQGANGMGIPIGKLALYTAVGGIHPSRVLPVLLDVGTDNADLLDDPEYVGWRHRRVSDEDHAAFVEAFVAAVEEELPGVLLQWEDLATRHARPVLERYEDRLCTFNDDIQGTAAVALGALSGAVRAAGSTLAGQTIAMLGAGSAAIGVADQIRAAMVEEGTSEAEARSRFWVIDVDGLLTSDRDDLTDAQAVYARDPADVAGWSLDGPATLADVVPGAGVTALVGLSTAHGAFTEAIVRDMAARVERPIVFPLSNPTSKAEAEPADLVAWTGGRVLVATGSPYAPVTVEGREVPVAQANNVYVFPAVGLGVVASGARRVTGPMLRAAARRLGEIAPVREDPRGALLPAIGDLREVARELALAVALAAVQDGVADERTEDDLRDRIAAAQWDPGYDGPAGG